MNAYDTQLAREMETVAREEESYVPPRTPPRGPDPIATIDYRAAAQAGHQTGMTTMWVLLGLCFPPLGVLMVIGVLLRGARERREYRQAVLERL